MSKGISANVGGSYQQAKASYVNVNGTWTKFGGGLSWATITAVSGTYKRHAYASGGGSWVAYEFTGGGAVVSTQGLVEVFILSGGSSFFQKQYQDVYGQGGQWLTGFHVLPEGQNPVTVGAGGVHQYDGTRSKTWGKPSSLGPIASLETVAGSGGNLNEVTNNLTGTPITYGAGSGSSNAPANSGNYSTKNAGSGVVVFRVPASFDQTGN